MSDEPASSHSSPIVDIHMLTLPNEVLEHIWVDRCLQYIDVCALGATCRKFREISNSNEVWRNKLCQRWSDLLATYPRSEQVEWKQEFCHRHNCGLAVRREIAMMSPQFFQKDEVSKEGFNEYTSMLKQHIHARRFVLDELRCIFFDGDSARNLTEKYYAEKALRFVQHLYLKEEWKRYLRLPEEEQQVETGAVLLAQWCQPTLAFTHDSIRQQLDHIADQVRKHLQTTHPNHPVCKTSYLCNTSDICKSQCKIVLEALNHVLYQKLGFCGNEENYYDPDNSFLNKVLERKTGIPISLSVMYIALAQRLGVTCFPVNFPSHFLIKWHQHPQLSDVGQQYTYIDVFNKGKFLSQEESNRLLDISFAANLDRVCYQSVPAAKVFERMAKNLVNIGRSQGMCLRTAVELLLAISPHEVNARILLVRLYLHLGINLTEAIDILQCLAASHEHAPMGQLAYLLQAAQKMLQDERLNPNPKPVVLKLRANNPEVTFSIGMIMKHRRYDYTCVLYGWDNQCEASQEWIVRMGVHTLPNKQHQPFYNVLVEDGSNRYAAQENLFVAPEPKAVTHPDVGKYFEEYHQTYYQPNKEKEQQYPEDMPITLQYVTESYPQQQESNV